MGPFLQQHDACERWSDGGVDFGRILRTDVDASTGWGESVDYGVPWLEFFNSGVSSLWSLMKGAGPADLIREMETRRATRAPA